ncbi:putative polysaccharide biosynthesis protein, partial [Granulicatella elegans]|uniref:putative polysaccharide biosynthesis protein n=1 Tax=Granulicatella elegans TaxID=137732 RepID=UPI003C7853A5
PVAISKIVADNQSRKDYETSWNIFKGGMLFMTATGIVSAIVMYVTAPYFAKGGSAQEIQDSIMVIRSLVPAVVIIPPLSLLRGYYQGYSDMAPSAKSQLWEQIVRIIYMLLLTFIVMKLFGGSYAVAVAHSTFAAFVGAVVAFVYLGYKMWKDMPGMKQLMSEGRPARNMSFGRIVFEVIREALPFVIVTSSIQLISILDQETFQPLAMTFTHLNFEQSKELLTIFGFNANKIIMIILSLAISISTAALPLLASYYSVKNHAEVKNVIEENIGLYSFIMIPASVGMAVVAEPIYNVFYSPSKDGTYLLMISCILCIFMGAFTVFTSIQQSMQQHMIAIKALVIALLVKMLWQPMMIYFFEGAGPLWATSLGFILATVYMGYHLYYQTLFNLKKVAIQLAKVMGISLVMLIVSSLTLVGLKQIINIDGKLMALIAVAIVGFVGAIVYAMMSLYTRLADELLGQRMVAIRRKLKMKE